MPKKRVPGHLNRAGRPRKRRDATPNLPRAAGDAEVEELDENPSPAPAAPVVPVTPAGPVGGRALRPTQRMGVLARGGQFRAAAPPPSFEQDYVYVVRDLRQITVLAVGAFAVLVGLSFVIR